MKATPNKRLNVTMKLLSVVQDDDAYPLTKEFTAEPLPNSNVGDKETAALVNVLPTILQAVNRTYGNGPRTVENYEAAIGDAIKGGKKFEAFLLYVELNLQHGTQAANCRPGGVTAFFPCLTPEEIGRKTADDPRVQALQNSFELEQAQHNLAEAIEMRRKIQRDDVPDGYVVDDFLANSLSMKGQGGEAVSLFLTAIRGNPYVSSYYKDLGDHFFREFRADLAWLCYDLGRAIPERDVTGNLSSIDRLERQLASRNPQFF